MNILQKINKINKKCKHCKVKYNVHTECTLSEIGHQMDIAISNAPVSKGHV